MEMAKEGNEARKRHLGLKTLMKFRELTQTSFCIVGGVSETFCGLRCVTAQNDLTSEVGLT